MFKKLKKKEFTSLDTFNRSVPGHLISLFREKIINKTQVRTMPQFYSQTIMIPLLQSNATKYYTEKFCAMGKLMEIFVLLCVSYKKYEFFVFFLKFPSNFTA